MSKITTLNEKAIAIEIPDFVDRIIEVNNSGNKIIFWDDCGSLELDLPEGEWSKLGIPEDIEEEQWKGIVDYKEGLPYTDFENKKGTPYYSDYEKPLFLPPNWNDPVGHELKLNTATESGFSLLKSKGLQDKSVIILIKQ